jgi:hypothetical protein
MSKELCIQDKYFNAFTAIYSPEDDIYPTSDQIEHSSRWMATGF